MVEKTKKVPPQTCRKGHIFFRFFAGMPWTDVSRCRGGSAPGPLGKGLGGVDEIVERNMNEKLDGKMSSIT